VKGPRVGTFAHRLRWMGFRRWPFHSVMYCWLLEAQ
jgi:hypothetical protein